MSNRGRMLSGGPAEAPPDVMKAAQAAEKAGSLEAALDHLHAVLAQEPEDAEALHASGRILLRLDRPVEAQQALTRAVARRPAQLQLHVLLARAAERAGQTATALECWTEVVRRAPEHAEGQLASGRLLLALDRPGEAERVLARAAAVRPNDVKVALLLARAVEKAERLDEAVTQWRRVRELDSRSFEADHALGRLLLRLGRVPEAEEALTRATALRPDHLPVAALHAQAVTRAGRLTEALAHYRAILAREPRSYEAARGAGEILARLGHLREADAMLATATLLRPDLDGPRRMRSHLPELFRLRRHQPLLAVPTGPSVSIIIPAHNAAATLPDALESILGQTKRDWEVIIVDDGSTDATVAVAEQYMIRDRRFRLISQVQAGVGAARNRGVAEAAFAWLLFLDADDWLLPEALQRLTETLAARAELDAAYCAMARVDMDGRLIEKRDCPKVEDLFAVAAVRCPFAIHSCVVRRSLVEEIGGFDTALRIGEEWDLWQRLARTGARWAALHEVLICYRVRPDSATANLPVYLANGLELIARGHAADPRVPCPVPAHADGQPAWQCAVASYHFVCWLAGHMIANCHDARWMLTPLEGISAPSLDADEIARHSIKATPDVAIDRWSSPAAPHRDFLAALERQSGSIGLSRRVSRALERQVVTRAAARRPLTFGSTLAVRVEATEPIEAIAAPELVDWLLADVLLEGRSLGRIELPVCDGTVRQDVLADAIAAQFDWPLLQAFFERTVYPTLETKVRPVVSVWRGEFCLAEEPNANGPLTASQLHAAVGQSVFLQEFWGLPTWPMVPIYGVDPAAATPQVSASGRICLEASADWVDLVVDGDELDVELRVGGTAVALVTVPVDAGRVTAHALRAWLTRGMTGELRRAAVREGLLGQPLGEGGSLRQRLAAAAGRVVRAVGCREAVPPADPRAALTRALGPAMLVLGRHPRAASGTSASRRAALPPTTAGDWLAEAAHLGRPTFLPEATPGPVVYAPDLLWQPERLPAAPDSAGTTPVGFNRHFFERLYARKPDPWNYGSPYEQLKYQQTLSLMPSRFGGRALELACAEGMFTVSYARRVKSLLATDVSQVALDRAAARCAELGNVRFAQLDLVRDQLPGRFDLIVCSEALYYLDGLEALRAFVQKILDALKPGGSFITAHSNAVVDDPDAAGFDWGVAFGAQRIGEIFAERLDPVSELRTPFYRIMQFRHPDGSLRCRSPRRVRQVEQVPFHPPSHDVAAHFLPRGGVPKKPWRQSIVTRRLPILMYHRVTSSGSEATVRWRVTPQMFEEQLRYLKDCRFRSIGLDEWRLASEQREPIPGNAVMLTFDDGYLDFLSEAWPLLERYGFGAYVFLVADRVGGTNEWDAAYGDPASLLRWDQARRLREAGVTFGSHSATHPYLTALSPAEVAAEALRSRLALERELGTPVAAFAYPYGAQDPAIRHLVGACGYAYGLTCRTGPANFNDDLLDLPRVEINGLDTLSDFIIKLTR